MKKSLVTLFTVAGLATLASAGANADNWHRDHDRDDGWRHHNREAVVISPYVYRHHYLAYDHYRRPYYGRPVYVENYAYDYYPAYRPGTYFSFSWNN